MTCLKEEIEWTDTWITQANGTDLSRVLLVGDSITRSYFPQVERRLAGRYACVRFTTSRFLADPVYFRELSGMFEEYEFSAIHFNNGLHGQDFSAEYYREGLEMAFEFLSCRCPPGRLIWAHSTPVLRREDRTCPSPRPRLRRPTCVST